VVLGLSVTGLGTVRALRAEGVTVYGASLSSREPGSRSRYCRVVDVSGKADDALCDWLVAHARSLDDPPVVFPTSDRLALLLARERERLARSCRLWSNKARDLEALIDKRSLYALAESVGLPVPPTLVDPTAETVRDWCSRHPGPYLVKPAYVGQPDAAMTKKNLVVATTAEVLAFLEERSGAGRGLMVQRVLRGGDGAIFDCYGYCGSDGRVRVLASHRRIRQYPPDFGITCYGEIPTVAAPAVQARLFAQTRRLLTHSRYHGIFGIEWLQDRASGELYLLDFNARPFYTIGHLDDCGLNLPALAYRDLCGDAEAATVEEPALDHLYWVDLWRDAASFNRKRKQGELGFGSWLSSVGRSRSFALWRMRDPMPFVSASVRELAGLVRRASRRSPR
jgi:predicted ATP-grasp superfamily ATP-dependent carboligase